MTHELINANCQPGRIEQHDTLVRRASYLHVIEGCQQLLDEMPTSLDEDKQMLALNQQGHVLQSWEYWQHCQLTLKYRIARKQTLQAVVKDLKAFSWLFCTCDA